MNLQTTFDVPARARKAFQAEVASLVEIDPSGVVMKDADGGPALIELLGQAVEWVTPFKIVATVFLSQLAKEAATDAWKNKAKMATLLAQAGCAPLRRFAEALASLRQSSRRAPRVSLGLSVTGIYFGAAFYFDDMSTEEAALAIACLGTYGERLEAFSAPRGRRGPVDERSTRVVVGSTR